MNVAKQCCQQWTDDRRTQRPSIPYIAVSVMQRVARVLLQ